MNAFEPWVWNQCVTNVDSIQKQEFSLYEIIKRSRNKQLDASNHKMATTTTIKATAKLKEKKIFFNTKIGENMKRFIVAIGSVRYILGTEALCFSLDVCLFFFFFFFDGMDFYVMINWSAYMCVVVTQCILQSELVSGVHVTNFWPKFKRKKQKKNH